MTRVVLSIGSNLGDRLARLQSVVDGARRRACAAVSPVYETDAWGGVEQGPFLNAVRDRRRPGLDAHGWLRRGAANSNGPPTGCASSTGDPARSTSISSPATTATSEVRSRRRGPDAAAPAGAPACLRAGAVAGRRTGRRAAVADGASARGRLLDRPRPRRARRGAAYRPGAALMGPTRKRDLGRDGASPRSSASPGARRCTGGSRRSRCGPDCRCWRSRVAEAGWAFYVRAKINDGRDRRRRPAGCTRWRWPRSVVIAKASAWVGALVLGWWVGVLVYLLPRRGDAAGRGRGHRRAPSWRPCARWRWWSPRCGSSIAASPRRTRPRTPRAPE